MDVVDTQIERVPEVELQLRNRLTLNETVTQALVDQRNLWDSGDAGKNIRTLVARQKRNQDEFNEDDAALLVRLKSQRLVITNQLSLNRANRKRLVEDQSKMRKEIGRNSRMVLVA